jgi:hypothetical protein
MITIFSRDDINEGDLFIAKIRSVEGRQLLTCYPSVNSASYHTTKRRVDVLSTTKAGRRVSNPSFFFQMIRSQIQI